MLSEATEWRLRPEVFWIEVGGSVVILQTSTGEFIELHRTAAELWVVLVAAAWSADAAVDHVLSASSASRAEAREVTEQYLRDLEAHEVLAKSARLED